LTENADLSTVNCELLTNTSAFNTLSLREAEGDEAISKKGLLRFARNDNYCVCIKSNRICEKDAGANHIRMHEMQEQELRFNEEQEEKSGQVGIEQVL
jgi:hypothetical protein